MKFSLLLLFVVSSKFNLGVVLFMVLKLLSKNRSEKAILSLLLRWKKCNMFCVISICCKWNQCFCHLEKAELQYRGQRILTWQIEKKALSKHAIKVKTTTTKKDHRGSLKCQVYFILNMSKISKDVATF